jgi:hypothetical protein
MFVIVKASKEGLFYENIGAIVSKVKDCKEYI